MTIPPEFVYSLSTESGGELDLVIPFKVDQIHLSDIAWGLAEGRYGNQCRRTLTVLQHSWGVCKILQHLHPKEPMLWSAGLLHDGAEAYLKDMPRPVLGAIRQLWNASFAPRQGPLLLDPLSRLHQSLTWAIEERFTLDSGTCSSATVHEADMMMFVLEWKELMRGTPPGAIDSHEQKISHMPASLIYELSPTERNTWAENEARYRFWSLAQEIGLTSEPYPARWQS